MNRDADRRGNGIGPPRYPCNINRKVCHAVERQTHGSTRLFRGWLHKRAPFVHEIVHCHVHARVPLQCVQHPLPITPGWPL